MINRHIRYTKMVEIGYLSKPAFWLGRTRVGADTLIKTCIDTFISHLFYSIYFGLVPPAKLRLCHLKKKKSRKLKCVIAHKTLSCFYKCVYAECALTKRRAYFTCSKLNSPHLHMKNYTQRTRNTNITIIPLAQTQVGKS